MAPSTAANVMRVVGAVTVGFGVIAAAAAYPPLQGPHAATADLLDWPFGDGFELTRETRFIGSIAGGFFAFAGMIQILIAAPAIEEGRKQVIDGIIVATLSWFVIDSTGSTLSGVASNVPFNILILIVFLGPLWVGRSNAWGTPAQATRLIS